MRRRYPVIGAILVFLVEMCSGQPPSTVIPNALQTILDRVAAIHGAAGVFAVAGYRMGERALRDLGADRGSFSLDVTNRTPLQVQYSCIADGWQAATGVSAGKLSLHIVETTPRDTETIVRNKATGQYLVFRLRGEFLTKYLDVPEEKQKAAGREVAGLPDDQIFTVLAIKK
ncbi:MAG TPA: FmdE family protein [Bryobacteraceae bacterium]|nr:FmdE family protein [Bryobacteraceae bacterium]